MMAVIGVLLSCPAVLAETIYMKNGQVIKGTVMQKNYNDVVIQVNGLPRKYYDGEIDRIEKDKEEAAVILPSITLQIDPTLFSGISPAKVSLILRLMEVNGTYENLKKSFDQTLAIAPPERQKALKQLFNVDDIVKEIVPILDKRYNEDDLRGLIQFYEGPLGQKMLKVTPELMKETMQTMVQYFKDKSNQSLPFKNSSQ